MACCEPIVQNFVDATTTDVTYGDYERALYGVKPEVTLLYLIGTEWVLGGVFTQVIYNADTITIDHGGTFTGYVKVG